MAMCDAVSVISARPIARVSYPKGQCHVGSCWVHSSIEAFERVAGYELSDSYVFAFHKVQQAKDLALEILRTPDIEIPARLPDNSYIWNFARIVERYGVIPKSAEAFSFYKDASFAEQFESGLRRRLIAFRDQVQDPAVDPAVARRLLFHSLDSLSFIQDLHPGAQLVPATVRHGRRELTAQDLGQHLLGKVGDLQVLHPQFSRSGEWRGNGFAGFVIQYALDNGFSFATRSVRYPKLQAELRKQLERGPVYIHIKWVHAFLKARRMSDDQAGKSKEEVARLYRDAAHHAVLVTGMDDRGWLVQDTDGRTVSIDHGYLENALEYLAWYQPN